MDYSRIINELLINREIFKYLLSALEKDEYLWKPAPEKWCILEVICHLYDEEREDFRARIKQVLENPNEPLSKIDPARWVRERKYIQQNFATKVNQFLSEREQSVNWLQSLNNPNWDSAHKHPKFGYMSAKLFLSNWLAHDYLHIRQLIKLKFDYLKQVSNESLNYAGEW